MRVCVRARALGCVRASVSARARACVRRAWARMCVCVCVRVCARVRTCVCVGLRAGGGLYRDAVCVMKDTELEKLSFSRV